MDILYGVCGVGMGHVSRSSKIVKELSKKNNVTIIGHGNSADYFKKEGFEVLKYEYVNLGVHENYLSGRKLLINTAYDLPRVISSFVKPFGKINGRKIDFVVSDFEWASLALSRYFGVKNLTISNYHLVDCFDFEKPLYYYMREVPIISYFKMNADKIVIPWDERLVKKKAKYVFAGIEKIKNGKIEKGKEYFGYFPDGIPDFYTGEAAKGWNRKKFLDTLSKAKAYFSHGGFSGIIEALNFQKPIGVVPTRGFYERDFNAQMIEYLGFGKKIKDKKDYELFGEKISEYSKNIKKKIKPEKDALSRCVRKEIKKV